MADNIAKLKVKRISWVITLIVNTVVHCIVGQKEPCNELRLFRWLHLDEMENSSGQTSSVLPVRSLV